MIELNGENKIKIADKNINLDSFNGIFLVGKNNGGKSRILKDFNIKYQQTSKFIKVEELVNTFIKEYEKSSNLLADLGNNRMTWFKYTEQNLELINEKMNHNLSGHIEIEFITEDTNSLDKENILDNFIINKNPLTSSGYLTLFLLVSYLLYILNIENSIVWLLLDECDTHLDIINKGSFISILSNIVIDKNIKIIESTHSPYTIVKTENYIVLNTDNNEIYYSNDISSTSIAEEIITDGYLNIIEINETIKKLSIIFKYMVIESRSSSHAESEFIGSLEYNNLTYKGKVLVNQIQKLNETFAHA